jgi:isoquinoline 1-oxidoreductase subunit beta
MSTSITSEINRRDFLAAAGGLTFSLALGAGLSGASHGAQAAGEQIKPNAWVTIGVDDTITVITPVGEMGQGTLTTLPLILAEELDANWSKVRADYAPLNPKLYGNAHPVLNGGQASVASIAVAGYFTPLRIAGAQARRVLMQAAASKWNVPIEELTTESSTVIHAKSGRHMSYGEIARFAEMPAELPAITVTDLKKPGQYRLIGRADIGRTDVPSKVDGSAKYGIDVMVPGMVYATVLESPLEGAHPDFVNTAEAMAVPGITHVLPLPFGVAVVGNTVEATHMARVILKPKVTWNTAGAVAAGFDSGKARQEYARNGQDPNAKTMEAFKKGDVGPAFSSAAKVIEGTYFTEHTYHAQMEPMNCTARVAEDGQSAEIWVGTQAPGAIAGAAAGVLKTTPDKIRIHQYLMGGGYGRRMVADIAAQAVVIANVTKKTVKLILTREDDMAAGRPRPMTHHAMRAAFDAQGNLVGWRHRIVAENVDAIALPPRFVATGGRDYIGWNGMELPNYAILNWMAEGVREIRGMRVQSFRGIGSSHNKFAVESFIDEIAYARKMDPLALRLELTQGDARANAVIKAAAEMSEWNRKRSGRALGIAFANYHGTLAAGVAEISLDRASGKIKVHNYWTAVDPGLVIQPTHALAQLEGASVWGLSVALLERLDIKDGAPVQSNFNDYPVLRMSDMPEIHTRIVASQAAPTGMGEIGVAAVAPAIGNALFSLTGKRIRELPMSPAAVKKTLA